MKQCPTCHKELKEQLLFCPYDGQPLIPKAEKDRFVGTTLDGKYRIDEKIGAGGMGSVYKATHLNMRHTVAIKILHAHLASDQTAVERFRREAQAAALIRHPNAINVTDFGVIAESGTAYIVMEFLEGVELRERIRRRKQLDYEETYHIINQTCQALQAAHGKGVIHRDLKPDNIWLLKTESGEFQVKVLDFGIAKLKESGGDGQLTQQGMIIGTPYYMSPEQCRGEELDSRSDLYSLGIIIYEMLTGRVPFQASTPFAVALKHSNEPPPPPRALRPDLPAPIERVMLRALSKGCEARPGSATQLAQEFLLALYESGIELKALGASPAPYTTYPSINLWPPPRPGTLPLSDSGETSRVATPADEPSFSSGARRLSGTSPLASDTPPQPYTSWVGALKDNAKLYLMLGAAALLVVIAVVLWAIRDTGTVVQDGEKPSPPPPVVTPLPPGMVRVTGGTFRMGTDDPAASPYSRPAREMTVGDFLLDTYEVTNLDYRKFVSENNYPAPSHWRNRQFSPGEDRLPVYNVSWEDAKAYAAYVNKRLPSEAEWEYAARGPENRKYPWGNDWSPRYSNSVEDNRDRPVPVGSYEGGRSWCGVYDLAGNVAEWVEDDFILYPGSSAQPQSGLKVFRGGAYPLTKEQMVSWVRYANKPANKLQYVGFRCAMDAPK